MKVLGETWAFSGFLPPKGSKLRWPHFLVFYAVSFVALNLVFSLLFFFSFPLLWYPYPTHDPSIETLVGALRRCAITNGETIASSAAWLALLPLWVMSWLWNRRVSRLQRKLPTIDAGGVEEEVWPPPPRTCG